MTLSRLSVVSLSLGRYGYPAFSRAMSLIQRLFGSIFFAPLASSSARYS
jgi:hypothetical protein